MVNVSDVMTGVTLAATLYQIARSEIEKYNQIQKYYAEQLVALRKEVRDNLETVNELMKKDASTKAVYDPAIRKSINSLSFKALKTTSEQFTPILGKNLKKLSKKVITSKDPMRIFYNIRDAANKLEDLSKRMKKIPDKQSSTAPKIMLMRRLPALKWRLEEIDKTLKIIPVPPRKK